MTTVTDETMTVTVLRSDLVAAEQEIRRWGNFRVVNHQLIALADRLRSVLESNEREVAEE